MTFVDREIAHIAYAMQIALQAPGDAGGPVLPTAYWRERLHRLIDSRHLSHVQLCMVDALLEQLDRSDATQRRNVRAHSAA